MTQGGSLEQTVPIWESAETETSPWPIQGRATPSASGFAVPLGSVFSMGQFGPSEIQSFIVDTQSQDVITQMQTEIDDLKDRVATLESEIEAMKASEEQIVVLRTVSKEQAKQEILALFGTGEALDQADLAERLSLELSLVAELCEELMQEGEIKYLGDAN